MVSGNSEVKYRLHLSSYFRSYILLPTRLKIWLHMTMFNVTVLYNAFSPPHEYPPCLMDKLPEPLNWATENWGKFKTVILFHIATNRDAWTSVPPLWRLDSPLIQYLMKWVTLLAVAKQAVAFPTTHRNISGQSEQRLSWKLWLLNPCLNLSKAPATPVHRMESTEILLWV